MKDVKAFLHRFNYTFRRLNDKGKNTFLGNSIELVKDLDEYYTFINLPKKNSSRMKTIPQNQMIWILIDSNRKILSSLHMTYMYELIEDIHKEHILQWSYSYTRDHPDYRRKGLNTVLRIVSMLWTSENDLDYIHSSPFIDGNANYILKKLNFTPFNNDFIQGYLKQIKDKKELLILCNNTLEYYLV